MAEDRKIGLFGGTFNPIHTGHVRAAAECARRLSLEKVIFVPSFLPPHKELADGVSPEHRLAMVRLAAAANPLLDFSDAEIARGGESYTFHTLRQFRKDIPGAQFHFILGVDAFLEIGAWYKFRDVLGLADWVVIARPGYRLENLSGPLGSIAGDFRGEDGNTLVRDRPLTRIRFLPIPEFDASSSAVRAAVRSGGSLRKMVPEAVADYIEEHRLYR